MKRMWTRLFLGLFVLLLACGSVWAQATAQISGAVQDQSWGRVAWCGNHCNAN